MKKYSDSIEARWTGRHEASLEAAGDLQNKIILDLGCGPGWFEAGAGKRGGRLTAGIDLDGELLAAAGREVPGARFLRAGLPDLPFRDGVFDLAVMWEVLEHLPARKTPACLRAVRRALKPKGRLLLSTPRFDFRSTLTDPAWYLGHRHYTRKALIAALARGGFRLLRIWSAGGPFEVISMLLFYPCKWIGGVEVPGKQYLERRRREEYRQNRGWSTYFVEAEKNLD